MTDQGASSVRIFVYGLLLPDQKNPVTILSASEDRIRARLYDLGEYPGAILDESAPWIDGSVIEVESHSLPVLDQFEEVHNGEYRRVLVNTERGLRVHVYEYGKAIAGRLRIDSWANRRPLLEYLR